MKTPLWIEVSIAEQMLRLLSAEGVLREYPASTAKNGAGELMDSECTPRGEHLIAEKIGAGAAPDSVFVGRRETGEIYTPEMRHSHPDRDWILTRIMWLRGTQSGKNLDGNVDSYNRYIYIHGCPDDVDIKIPGSRGCVRLRNEDVIDLFDRVEEGTTVIISEN